MGTRYENRLAGCVFLKSTPLQDAAELKGLTISTAALLGDEPIDSQRARVAERLVGKAVRYCQVREVPKIEIEIPQDDHTVVSLFLRIGFRVTAIREKYKAGQFFCVLERTVGDTYAADPFDYTKISRWLLRAILPCQIEDAPPMFDSFHVLRFHVDAPHPGFGSLLAPSKRLSGLLAILEENECGDEDIKRLVDKVLNPEQAFVRYALLATSPSPDAQAMLTAAGVIPFDLEDTRVMAGGESSSLAIPFARDEIGGVVTVLEQNAIHTYKRHSTFVYFLLSGIGGTLELAEGSPLMLAIYCPYWLSDASQHGEAGLVGFAEITEIKRGSYEHAIDAFEGIPTALAKEDLDFYRTFGENQVVALLCEQVRLFSSPIPIPISQQQSNDGQPEGLSEWNYLHRELVEHLASTVYLSETAAAYFRLLPEQSTEPVRDLGPDFDWGGPDDPEELQRFIRRSPLTLALDFLERAIENSESVCLVDVLEAESCGSGVLVTPDLVLTCNALQHVTPLALRVSFQANSSREIIEMVADLAAIHPDCDAVLLRIRGDNRLGSVALRPVTFSQVVPRSDEDLNVLHHPRGGELQLTLSPGGVVGSFLGRRALQYVTATAPGSSGGPCFNSNWELVGIHRAQRSKGFWNYGEGVLVPTVLDSWIAGIAKPSVDSPDMPSDK
jgi:hypothetical protein